jgi:hypothetical protein
LRAGALLIDDIGGGAQVGADAIVAASPTSVAPRADLAVTQPAPGSFRRGRTGPGRRARIDPARSTHRHAQLPSRASKARHRGRITPRA